MTDTVIVTESYEYGEYGQIKKKTTVTTTTKSPVTSPAIPTPWIPAPTYPGQVYPHTWWTHAPRATGKTWTANKTVIGDLLNSAWNEGETLRGRV